MTALHEPDARLWQWIEQHIAGVVHRYGYREIRLPIVESARLYRDAAAEPPAGWRDDVILRPDGTPGCVRAVIEERGAGRHRAERLWYQGPMFRLGPDGPRQVHQFAVEAFGMQSPALDAELIMLSWDLFAALGLKRDLVLQINTVGDWAEQQRERRPGVETRRHFAALCSLLDRAGVPYRHNPELVGGRGYYSRTVFDWQRDGEAAGQPLASGGRYDDLASHAAGRPMFAAGFALHVDHLLHCLAVEGAFGGETGPQVVLDSDAGQAVPAVMLARTLRKALPGMVVVNRLPPVPAEVPASARWHLQLQADGQVAVAPRDRAASVIVPQERVAVVILEGGGL